MKKMFYVLISLMLSAFLVNSAKADTNVVMGLGGPQVVTNSAPPPSHGPTIGGGVIHDSPIMGSVPMAVVSPENDMVTNVIMCEPSQCKSGAFAGSRDVYVPQITPENTGIWGGPGTTKYDFDTQTFTIEYPAVETEESVLNSDGTVNRDKCFKGSEIYSKMKNFNFNDYSNYKSKEYYNYINDHFIEYYNF